MIHSSIDPRQSIPLNFLPNSLHAAAAGVSHSSASRAGLGAAPLFLDDHLSMSVSSRLRALKRAASRLLHHPVNATQPKTAPVVVADTKTPLARALITDTSSSILTPPASPQLSFASIPSASPPRCEQSPSRHDSLCENEQVETASAIPAVTETTPESVHAKPPTLANDSAYLPTPGASPKAAPISPSSRRSVSFAADLVTQTIVTYSHDEYPDRSDATPPRRLKFAEAAQIMAFQSLMRRQHAMIAVDDEAPGFVHEKCPACKGFHVPLSAKMEGWTVPTLEYMEERGM